MATRNGIEFEILDSNNLPRNENLPQVIEGEIVDSNALSVAYELANALTSRIEELDRLKLKFLDNTLNGKEKLNEILRFKALLLMPSLKNAFGHPIDPELLRGSFDLMTLITSIEATIKNIIAYEEQENVDFTHPKIIAGMNMLFELVMECVAGVVQEPVLVREIAEKCAVRAVGIESELNKTFKNISNKMAQSIENPITESFRNRNKDAEVQLNALKESLLRASKALENDLGRDTLKAKIKELHDLL